MKKIYALTAAMMMLSLAPSVSAETITEPEPGKEYLIQHRESGLYFSVVGGKVKLQDLGDEGAVQTFKFDIVEDEAVSPAFAIPLGDDQYLGTDSSWTPKVMTGCTDRLTHFSFPLASDPYVYIWCVGHSGNSYWAPDNLSVGSSVYSNKGASTRSQWLIIESTGGLIFNTLDMNIAALQSILDDNEISDNFPQVAYDMIKSALDDAEAAHNAPTQALVNDAAKTAGDMVAGANALLSALNTASEAIADAEPGDTVGCYSQADYDTLQAAIEAARGMWSVGAASIYTEAAETLTTATNTFSKQRIMLIPAAGSKYVFVNTYNGYALGISSNNEAVFAAISGGDDQAFEITAVEGSKTLFNLKVANGAGYLAKKGSWNTTLVSELTADANIGVYLEDAAKSTYTLRFFDDWRCLAGDGNSAGDLVYTDKGTWFANAFWQLVELKSGELFMLGYDNAVASAEKTLAGATVGEQPGNYPQEAYDALNAALEAAKGASLTTQEDVNSATAALLAAISAFNAEKIDPFFVPEEGAYYRFSNLKYRDKYTTNNDGTVGTKEFTPMDKSQWLTFQPVEGAKYTYIIKNEGKVMTYEGKFEEMADADAPKWTTVYTNKWNNTPCFGIVEYENPSKCITFGSGTTFAIQDFTASNNAHQNLIVIVDPVNDPNLTNLIDWVNYAYVVLDGVDRGPAVGQISDAKCEAFEALIKELGNYAGCTQEQVDAKVTELDAAIKAFQKNVNSVIKDELEAAIEAAQAKADAAVVGVEVGQYYQSAIEAFEASIAEWQAKAEEVAEQDECDALTAEVTTATEDFTGNEVAQPVADVFADYITCAEALYEAEKDNVGDNLGERPQEVVDAFKAAIDAAKAVTDPTLADLETLVDARAAFLNGAMSVNRTPLRKALEQAAGEEYSNLVAGDFDGNYPQDAIDTFETALAAAQEIEADMTKTQEEVDAATKALTDAMAALKKAKVTIKFTALDAAITAAKAAVASATEIGSGENQCPQAVVDALQAIITEAEGIDRAAINQADVDALATKLTEGTATFRTALVESTGLAKSIADAQAVADAAVAGEKPGNYPSSAIDNLKAAIAAATAVMNNAAATQAELIAAAKTLDEAVVAFKTLEIGELDLDALNELIAEVEAWIAQTGSTDYALKLALDEAKDLVANATEHSQADVVKATSKLKKAFEDAKKNAGLNEVTAAGLTFTSINGQLTVAGLRGEVTVMIFATDGRMIARAETADAEYTVSLVAGQYVVALQADGFATSRVVIVK